MNELLGELTPFMIGLILIESTIFLGSLWFAAYLSRKDKDDNSTNNHN
jgi:hypothetical protein